MTAELAPPIVPYIARDDAGQPYLQGVRCTACGHVYIGLRLACAKCLARDNMETIHLPTNGKLYSFSIIHRSFPGAQVPFIDAIVDLDGGGHIKGTLRGISPDPADIPFDLPVKIVFAEAEPANAPGKPHLTYFFEPS